MGERAHWLPFRFFELSSDKLMAVGFLAVLTLLGALIFVWNANVKDRDAAFDRVSLEHERASTVSTILAATRRQFFALTQMAYAGEVEERAQHHRAFQEAVEVAARARDELSSRLSTELELRRWETAENLSKVVAMLQRDALESIFRGETAAAQQLIAQKLMPSQAEFVAQLEGLLETHAARVRVELDAASAHNRDTYLLIGLLGVAATLWSGLTIWAIQRNSAAERQLLAQGDRIRALYEVSAQPGLSVDDQINTTLEMGCRMLALDIGKVCRINETSQTNTFLYAVAVNGADVKPGSVLPLEKTFCSIPFRSGKAIAISHVNQSEYSTYPCYEFSHLEAYIAAPVWLNGVKHGTINFASKRPRARPFDRSDLDLVHLISNWVAVVLERQMAADLRIEKHLADQANSAKNAYLANLSHELRTPLNSIIGYAELLEDELGAREDTVSHFKDAARIKLAASHLLLLVNGRLDLSSFDAGSLEIRCETFPVRRVLDEVTAMLMPVIDRSGNRCSVTCEDGFAVMYSDPIRLKETLVNLVTNASKCTSNGLVTLHARREGESAIFEVADSGIALPEEEAAALPRAIVGTNGVSGGCGLGLAICQRICRMLGGTMSVSSRAGHGSVFTVNLPINYSS